MNKNPSIVFFGTSEFSVLVLGALKEKEILPSLIVTAMDKPVGRKKIVTSPPVKIWAQENNIPVLQPESLAGDFFKKIKEVDGGAKWDLFVVAAYGKIIPPLVLKIPRHGTLNVHPSLLPKFRGASPIESAILEARETGVTIMKVDEKMDHGPIVSQQKLETEWPQDAQIASHALAQMGGDLLARIIPKWLGGNVEETPQRHEDATFTKKIATEDGLIELAADSLKNWKIFLAYRYAPGVYFFTKRNGKTIRVRVTKARFEDGQFVIERVIPEGKKEMEYVDFKRGERRETA